MAAILDLGILVNTKLHFDVINEFLDLKNI